MMLEAFEAAQIRPRLWQPLRDGTSRRRIALPAARMKCGSGRRMTFSRR